MGHEVDQVEWLVLLEISVVGERAVGEKSCEVAAQFQERVQLFGVFVTQFGFTQTFYLLLELGVVQLRRQRVSHSD